MAAPAEFPAVLPEGNPEIEGAKAVCARLRAAGHEAYFAGGAVRDLLLGKVPHDVDIATAAVPDEVQKLFRRATGEQGASFAVVRVMEGERTYEVATFRHDGSYSDGRHPDRVTFTNAEEDVKRRDFTVNGLFLDPGTSRVLDYVEGRRDLERKCIRAIGDPETRFREDRLRLFRAVRFAVQLGFAIEPETWKAVCRLAPLSKDLAPERVREELVKCLVSPDPARAFELLDDSGLFRVWVPEVEELKGCEQPPQFHPEGDVFKHVRLMFSLLRKNNPTIALSVLLHDIAKPATATVDPDGRIRFNGHETVGARMAEAILRRLRFPNQVIEDVSSCVRNHMAFKDAKHMRVSKLKRMMSRPTFEDEMELHRVDCLGSHRVMDVYDFLNGKREEFSQEEIQPEPLLNGNDLMAMGVKPGPVMGKILGQLMDEQLEGRLKTRGQALEYARQFAASYLGDKGQ
jgi:poly(A) polymerase